jgi:DNA-binding CsgD family transcriptional regulator
VATVSEHDASALLAFVSELRALDDPLPFPPQLLPGLRGLIASKQVAYSELDPVQRSSILQVWHGEDGDDLVSCGDDLVWPEPGREVWWSLRHTHPTCGYRTASGDWTTPWKVSDFLTLRQFRRTPIYDAFYRGEIDHWLDIGLPPEPHRTRIFIFNRFDEVDFDERDRLVASLLQPHLARRAEDAEAALRAAEALGAIEDGTIDEARRVVLCSAGGVIEFGSASSRELLERYLGLENGRIPTPLLARRQLTVQHDDRSLRVRIARTGNLHVLMLEEHLHSVEKLTVREREVLEQVVVGKGNEAVALELGIAPATVSKHLEHAYRKLGVQNRTAAAALLDSTR